MRFETIVFLFCYSISFSQRNDSICISYDNFQKIELDSTHFLYKATCNEQPESTALYTYKYLNGKKVADGKYYNKFNENIIEEGFYKEGKRAGVLIFYYPNQKVKEFIQFLNDSVQLKTNYFESGALKSYGSILFRRKIGFWSYYNENGTISKSGSYSYIKTTKSNKKELLAKTRSGVIGEGESFKDGDWRIYNEAGEVKKIETYNMGTLVN